MRKIMCEGYGRRTPSFEIVNYGSMDKGYKQLCTRCFNTEAATAAGLDDFEHVDLEPVRLTDSRANLTNFISARSCSEQALPWTPSNFATETRRAISTRLSPNPRKNCSHCSAD
ncbi:DUF7685 domain-containing protein [Methylocystis silviterrae]|uniref:DUF7685 domain-containing protein n=1 Tax=Methylocystis silviterrae TaxID=2743612 RepID=UPI003C738CC9